MIISFFSVPWRFLPDLLPHISIKITCEQGFRPSLAGLFLSRRGLTPQDGVKPALQGRGCKKVTRGLLLVGMLKFVPFAHQIKIVAM